MAYIDVVAVKKAVKDGALIAKVIDGNILLADVNSGEAAKIGELPVVRCKDCTWFGNADEIIGRCITHNRYIYADQFCSYGERKDDGA